jgi:type VI protein secretion system component VasF
MSERSPDLDDLIARRQAEIARQQRPRRRTLTDHLMTALAVLVVALLLIGAWMS